MLWTLRRFGIVSSVFSYLRNVSHALETAGVDYWTRQYQNIAAFIRKKGLSRVLIVTDPVLIVSAC
jgi:hypothetical protein